MTDCPECERTYTHNTFYIGQYYCPDCDIRFMRNGEIVGQGRL